MTRVIVRASAGLLRLSMMKRPSSQRATRIETPDFDAFASELSAAIWNELIEKPSFYTLELKDYADIFAAVSRSLLPYYVASQQLPPL